MDIKILEWARTPTWNVLIQHIERESLDQFQKMVNELVVGETHKASVRAGTIRGYQEVVGELEKIRNQARKSNAH